MTPRWRHGARWPIPSRVLVALALTVLLAHAVVLREVAVTLGTSEQVGTRVFTTRSITITPPPAPALLPRRPVTATPPPAAPARVPRPRTAGAIAAVTVPFEPPASAAAAPDAAAPPAPPEPEPEPVLEPVSPVADATATEPVPVTPVDAASDVTQLAAAVTDPSAPLARASVAEVRSYRIPGSVRLHFDAVGKRGRLDYKAMGTLTWLQDGSRYDMQLEMGDWIIGKRVLSSTGTLGADGLAPMRFSDKFRSERAAHFDRTGNRITFSANTPPATLLPGAQDQLSLFAQLAATVAGDPLGFPIGTVLDIQTAGPREAERWLFSVEREEMLNLPGGQVPALKLTRKPGKAYDQTVELWLAPELAYLPARIRITFANGDYLDQQWRASSSP